MAEKIAGTIFFQINGVTRNVVGNWEYNLGADKNETMVGADRIHGIKSMPQAAYISGDMRDAADLDVKALCNLKNATITLQLANGKTIILSGAYFTGDGTVSTEDAIIKARFDGDTAEEVSV